MASSEHLRKNTDGKQRALRVVRKYSASRNLYQVIANQGCHLQNRTIGAKLGRFNQSQQLTANCPLLDAKLLHVASRESVDGRSRTSRALKSLKVIY